MSALGKVFSINVFFAAASYLGSASALYLQRSDYRKANDYLKSTLQELSRKDTEQIKALQARMTQRDDEIDKNRAIIEAQRQANQTLGSHYEDKVRELAERAAAFGTLLESHRTVAEQLGEKETQISNLTRNLEQAKTERNRAYTEKETAEEQLAVMHARLADLEEDNSDLKILLATLQEDLNASESMLSLLREKYDISMLVAGVPAPPIDAKVLFVSEDTDPAVCTISVGDSSGVKAGYTFVVYRGKEFIGQVLVERVLENMAHCRVLFLKGGARLQQGDSATTR